MPNHYYNSRPNELTQNTFPKQKTQAQSLTNFQPNQKSKTLVAAAAISPLHAAANVTARPSEHVRLFHDSRTCEKNGTNTRVEATITEIMIFLCILFFFISVI
ncbi:hypothetical protein V6Z11_D10G158000 [Gossypium hirsutum]